MAVQIHLGGAGAGPGLRYGLVRPASACGGSAHSRRTARARVLGPNPTITVISTTPAAGRDVMTRRTRGWTSAASLGPSCRMRRRACSLVQGLI